MASAPQILNLSDGATIAYHRTQGKSPGVIFLGGFMSDMSGTKATILESWCQARNRAFLRFDYSGHGASSGRFEDGTIGLWAAEALAVLDRLTVGPQILVGSSMGAWIMLLIAQARPARIAGLLGVACAADFLEDAIWNSLDEPTRLRLQRDGVIYAPSDYDETRYPITLNLIHEAREHKVLNKDTLPIACPVRLLHGMNDESVPWETSIKATQRLASSDVQVVLVKDGEHRMSRDQDLAKLTELLAELIADIREGMAQGAS
jgi:pimeloyl-ACP methyl ester carboxylesterase